MRPASIFCSLALVLLHLSAAAPVSAQSELQTDQAPVVARVYILAGQSNMQGAGQAKELDRSWRTQQIEGAFMYQGDEYAVLDPGRLAIQGARFGPEIGLAHYLRNNQPGRPHVFIIKFALSGQPLDAGWNGGAADGSSWVSAEPGPKRKTFYPGTGPSDPNIGLHYKKMHDHITAGIQALKEKGYVPQVQGIVWMQGEQDAKNEVAAGRYDKTLGLLKARLEQDFTGGKDVPFVFGQVLPHEPAMARFTHRDLLRKRMAEADWRSKSDRAIENVWMVSTDGVELKEDTVHYSTKGLLALGQSFGLEILKAERKAELDAKDEK